MLPLQHRHSTAVLNLTAVVSILLLLPSSTSQAQILKRETLSFGPFNNTNADQFEVIPTASISQNALQITPDSAGSTALVPLDNNSGRIFFKKPFTLWNNDESSELVSFNTSFLINVFRVNNGTPGEGLAFIIAPSLSIPLNSSGRYLGLTNASTDGNVTNRFVAVELDTVKQDFDIDDNHIGLDINSIHSNVNVSLSPLGIEIAPNRTQFYVLWIEYDGDRKLIEVYMAPQSSPDVAIVPKPGKPVLILT